VRRLLCNVRARLWAQLHPPPGQASPRCLRRPGRISVPSACARCSNPWNRCQHAQGQTKAGPFTTSRVCSPSRATRTSPATRRPTMTYVQRPLHPLLQPARRWPFAADGITRDTATQQPLTVRPSAFAAVCVRSSDDRQPPTRGAAWLGLLGPARPDAALRGEVGWHG
jgi:hypothetical protein